MDQVKISYSPNESNVVSNQLNMYKPRQFSTSTANNKPSFADVVLAISNSKTNNKSPRGCRSSLYRRRSPNISRLRSSSYNAVSQPMLFPKTESVESKTTSPSFLLPPTLNCGNMSSAESCTNVVLNEPKLTYKKKNISLEIERQKSQDYKDTAKFRTISSDRIHKEYVSKFSDDIEKGEASLKRVTKLNTLTLSQDTSIDSNESFERLDRVDLQSTLYSIHIDDSGYRSFNQSSSRSSAIFDFSLTIPECHNSRNHLNSRPRTASSKRKSFSKQKFTSSETKRLMMD